MDPIESVVQTPLFGLSSTDSSILGRDDFLRILVTQLRNQDPLNPVAGDEFAAQLAQFSSLEQLQNINTSLETLMELDFALNQAINNTMATTFIGKGLTAVGNQLSVAEGEPTNVHYELSSAAATITIEILNEAGAVVRTAEVLGETAGRQHFEWDGKDENGNAVPEGQYTFNVTAQDSSGNNVAAQPLIVGTIDSIRYRDGNAVLRLGNIEVDFGAVLEIGANASTFTNAETDE